MKCLDTTYFIDLIKKPELIRSITEKLDKEGVHATTTLNIFESLFGAFAIGEEKGEKMKDKLMKTFNKLEIFNFNYKDALLAAELGGKLRKMGKTIDLDVIIAAIALNNGCDSILTRNKRHFNWFKEIIDIKIEFYEIKEIPKSKD